MVGQTIGKYRIVSRLGRGGMGTVYKAVDESLDREVAIKCLNPDVADGDVLKRFRAEAVMLARLNHPNIATLFELTEHDGQLLMVMEFVRGETFDQMSNRVGAMPIDRAAHLCVQVLDALACAHRAGVVHRDLKLANLMVNESGRAKVMDFGIARMAGGERLTNNGFMVGTPAYMSPEQVLGGDIDGRADLYAMGVVFYRLLTAQLPFKADTAIAMAQKQLHDTHTPVRQLRTELPAECEEILTRALAKAPGDRYPTAEHFKAALEVLSGVAAAEMMPTLTQPAVPAPRLDPTLLPMPVTPRTDVAPAPTANTAVAPPTAAARTPVAPATAPESTVVAPATAPAALTTASVQRRSPATAAVAVGAVMLAGVLAVLLWRARAAKPDVAPGPASAPPALNGAATASPTAPPVSPPAGVPIVRTSPTPSPGPLTSAAKDASPTPPEAPAAKDSSPSPRGALPIVTFARLKFLLMDEGKARDRDASLRLGDDALDVLDGDKTIQSAPYGDVIGLFHSHSREPRWATPDGTALPVIKIGSKFGFLKGVPDWITVRTRSGFIPLRVRDEDLERMIAGIEARTSAKVVHTR